MSNSSFTLPNPLTPLAFLPPDVATELEVSRYVYAATLGAALWDIAMNLGNDHQLLWRHPIRLPIVVYFTSRIFTLLYITLAFTFTVATPPNCDAVLRAAGMAYLFAHSLTAMLFLIRTNAVWCGDRTVKVIFGILWIVYTASAITVPVGLTGTHIGPTKACINSAVPSYQQAVVIMALVYDTSVFVAITYRILTFTLGDDTLKGRLRAFIYGDSLSKLSQALMQGGQHYYLAALCGNIVVLLMVVLPSVPVPYRACFSIPVIFITNSMACIVFRKIKFGLLSADGTAIVPSIPMPSFFRATAGGAKTHTATLPLPLHFGDVSESLSSQSQSFNSIPEPKQSGEPGTVLESGSQN